MRALVLFMVAVAAAISAGDASARHDATPNPFTTRASRAAEVHFVPLDGRSAALLRQAVPFVKRWLNHPVEITAVPTSKSSWIDPAREQVNSVTVMKDLLARFRRAQGSRSGFLIPVTSQSMYFPEMPQYRFVFGAIMGEAAQSAAIVATAQMRVFHPERERARMTKMILRYIGLGACHLPQNGDPKSVLYSPLLSDADLDRMVATLPKRC